jgi:hypothetical protein
LARRFHAEYLVEAQCDQIVRLRHARVTHLMSGEIQRIGDMTQLLLRSAVLGAMLTSQSAHRCQDSSFEASTEVGLEFARFRGPTDPRHDLRAVNAIPVFANRF